MLEAGPEPEYSYCITQKLPLEEEEGQCFTNILHTHTKLNYGVVIKTNTFW